MAGFFAFVFSTAGIVLLFVIGAAWMCARPADRLPPRILLALSIVYLHLSVFGVSFQIERALVRGYAPLTAADVPQGRTAIVVLGSGSFTTRSWDGSEFTAVDYAAAERVLETARLYRLIRPERVISSGGTSDPDDPDTPTGEAMRVALIDLGVPASAILVETRSRNTHDEALVVRDMLRPLGTEHTVLVTSARHMRRSVGTFRAAGLEVIPAIARNSYVDRPWPDRWLPSEAGLWESRDVMHEVLGLTAYVGRGWYQF